VRLNASGLSSVLEGVQCSKYIVRSCAFGRHLKGSREPRCRGPLVCDFIHIQSNKFNTTTKMKHRKKYILPCGLFFKQTNYVMQSTNCFSCPYYWFLYKKSDPIKSRFFEWNKELLRLFSVV
jgi:hypothetical protein